MDNYYVYAHAKATTGEVFYVGKGKGSRAKALSRRSVRWHNYVRKYGYIILYLETNLVQEDAFKKEVYYIKKFGRKDLGEGELVNMSDGGVGGNNNKGRVFSEEWKKKLGEASRGRPGYMLGKKMSEEIKDKISKTLKGRPAPWLIGRKMSGTQMAVRLAKKPCEYCGVVVNAGNYKKWHGGNCKHRNGIVLKEKKIHPSVRLTEDIVKAIREEFDLGGKTKCGLAIKYDVSATTISDIIHKKAWKYVD